MIGTFGTTTIVVEGVEGLLLTIVGMGVKGILVYFWLDSVLILV
jgi:hypothetical protein